MSERPEGSVLGCSHSYLMTGIYPFIIYTCPRCGYAPPVIKDGLPQEDRETIEVIEALDFSENVKTRLGRIYFDWRSRGYSAHDAYYQGVIGWLQEVIS